jgi:hypothetical protein
VIRGGVHEVGELDFGYWAQATHGHADSNAGDAELHHGRVDDAFGSKLSQEAVGRPKHTPERTYVFAEDNDAFVAQHLLAQGFSDGLDDSQGTDLIV